MKTPITMYTKSGMEFTVSFSDEPDNIRRLAKFFLLLADNPNSEECRKRDEIIMQTQIRCYNRRTANQ